MIVTLIVLVALSGFAKAVSDTLLFRFERSVFSRFPGGWWNPTISYKNKNKSQNYFVKLLMRTVLVMFTDAWHLFQFISYFSLFLLVTLVHTFGLPDNYMWESYTVGSAVLLAIGIYWIRIAAFSFFWALFYTPEPGDKNNP